MLWSVVVVVVWCVVLYLVVVVVVVWCTVVYLVVVVVCPAGRYNKDPSGCSHCFSRKFRSMHLLAIRNLAILKNFGGQIGI